MSKQMVRTFLTLITGLLTMGSLALVYVATPSTSTLAVKLTGYDGPNITLGKTKTDVQVDNERAARFATPHIGQKFHGVPHHPSTIYATDYTWQGHGGWWCTGYTLHSSDGTHNKVIHGQIPGYSKANSRAAFKIMNADDGLISRVAGVSKVAKLHGVKAMTLWYLSNDRNFHADWPKYLVPQMQAKGDMSGFNRLLAWGRDHGSYKVTVKLPKASVGQTGHGTVVVRAANGHAASNLQVSLSGNDNVKVSPQGGMTNGKGQLSFTYKVIDYGRVKVSADVTAASSNQGLLTDASPGRQKLLTGHYTEHAHGSAAFRTAKGTVEISQVCQVNCDGVATVTWTAQTAKSSTKPQRFRFYIGSDIKGRCDARSAGRKCAISKGVDDGSTYAGYDFCTLDKVGGTCISGWTRVKLSKEIICPPAPSFTYSLPLGGSCNCDGSSTFSDVSFEATFTSKAGSRRFYEGFVTDVTTGDTQSVSLTNGTPGSVDLPFHNSDEYQMSYKVFDHQGGALLRQDDLKSVTVNVDVH